MALQIRTALIALMVVAGVAGAELTDTEIARVLEGFEARRDAVLISQIENPYPALAPDSDYQIFGWHHLDFALAALYMNVEIERANASVLAVVEQGAEGRIEHGNEERFHWLAPLLCRIYELFHADSPHFPARLTPETEAGIRDVMWAYIEGRSDLSQYSLDRVWWMWGSENHDAQRLATLWGGLSILQREEGWRNRELASGGTVAEHFEAINRFVKERLREHVRRGMLVECASPGYGKYTLQCWHNFYDFGDAELRHLAEAALKLWWADWAQEQIGAVRGGAKARVYQGPHAQRGDRDDTLGMAWFHLGIGRSSRHPGVMCLATSDYRLPPVVVDLALDVEGRGTYEILSRRPGLMADRDPATYPRRRLPGDSYQLDPDYGGLLRVTYCTPDFIMGSWTMEKRSRHDWSAISSQNRWQGVIFAGSDRNARIFPQCEGLGNGKTYNQYWGVQSGSTMILSRLEPPLSHQAGDLRVFFSDALERSQDGLWVFARAESAYAAVRLPDTAEHVTWDDENWLRLPNSNAPLVIHCARSEDYADMESFAAACRAAHYELTPEVLTFQAPGGPAMRFFHASDRLPEVDGEPANLEPPFTYASPFVRGEWPAGVVTIRKGSRELTLDVR